MAHTELVIGITTVRRLGPSDPGGSVAAPPQYLKQTVSSLLAAMSDHDCRRVRIVVHNANDPPGDHREVADLESRIAAARCPITVIESDPRRMPPGHDGRAPERTSDEPPERRAWRSKQCLDYAFTLRLCRESGCEYVLMLEDDVVASERFVPKTLDWLRKEMRDRNDWLFVALWCDGFPYDARPFEYTAGAVALLFRNDGDLDRLAAYVESRFDAAPLDWLLRDYLKETGRKAYARIPSLFDHVGRVRSYRGAGAERGYPATSPSFRLHDDRVDVVALRRTVWRLRRFLRSRVRRLSGRPRPA